MELSYERDARTRGYDYVIGVDEAGRGPLCGPVTAAAFCWLGGLEPHGTYEWTAEVNDSKQLSEERREELFAVMGTTAECVFEYVDYGAEVIDGSDILAVTLRAMTEAVLKVVSRLEKAQRIMVYVDGNRVPAGLAYKEGESLVTHPAGVREINAVCVVKGDSLVFSVAAASMVAKCHRDSVMRAYAALYPGYGLEVHKGYGTAAHRAALARLGPTPIHRLTFEPCRGLLEGTHALPAGRAPPPPPKKRRPVLKTQTKRRRATRT